MNKKTDNETIAKNTLLLYFRMILTMCITLYTSRVILQKLGVDDYGIYQAVGGIVGSLSFINGALATGSSRFITYALGKNDESILRKTFSTTLLVHLFLALIFIFISETIGLWFLNGKMVIGEDRINAANWTYHFSILTAVLTLLQVPFNAIIIAHERMLVYAYLSIFDAVAKLSICYFLTIGNLDKLIVYSALLCFTQFFILFFYWFYCNRKFIEVRLKIEFDKLIFKEIAVFSGWSLFANAAIALNNQGILILLNIFFSPAIVTARAISLQVNSAANQFVGNFRQAVNPQIVKKYASGDKQGSKKLLLESTKFSYYLMLMLSLPICYSAEPIIKIWLGVVPEYSIPFLQIVVIQSLFQVFDTSFYTALYTKGRLRENALISPILLFLLFPIVFILFKMGYSPLVLSWGGLIVYIILGLFIKPLLLLKIVDYTLKDIYSVYKPCLYVTLLSIPIPTLLNAFIDIGIFYKFCFITIISLVNIVLAVYYVGINNSTRLQILSHVKSKIKM